MLVGASQLGSGSGLGALDPFLVGVAAVGGHAVLTGGIARGASDIKATLSAAGTLQPVTMAQPEAPLYVRFI